MTNTPIQVTLTLAKETRNNVRYNAERNDRAAIDALYIKKFALNGSRPRRIKVSIETQ